MKSWLKLILAVFALLAVGTLVILPLVLGLLFYLHHRDYVVTQEREMVSIKIPDTSATLTMYKKRLLATHPHYLRRLKFEQPGEEEIVVTAGDSSAGHNELQLFGIHYKTSMDVYLVEAWLDATTETLLTKLQSLKSAVDPRVHLRATVPAFSEAETTQILKLGTIDSDSEKWHPEL